MTDRVQTIIDLIDGVLDNPTQQAGDTAYYRGSEKCWRCEERRPAKDSNVGLCAQCKADLAEERPVEFEAAPLDETRLRPTRYQSDVARDQLSGWPDEIAQWRQRPPLGASLAMSPAGRDARYDPGRGIAFEQDDGGWTMIYHGFRYQMGPEASITYRSGQEHFRFFTTPRGLDLQLHCRSGHSSPRSTGRSSHDLREPRYWVVTARYQGVVGSWGDSAPLPGALLDDYGTWQEVRWEPHRGWGEVYYPSGYHLRLHRTVLAQLPTRQVVRTGRLLAFPPSPGPGLFAWELQVASDR